MTNLCIRGKAKLRRVGYLSCQVTGCFFLAQQITSRTITPSDIKTNNAEVKHDTGKICAFFNCVICSCEMKITPAVIVADITPCKHLPRIYGFKLNPASAVTDITCKCTESPENPTINEVRTSFSAILMLSPATFNTPVENSHSPETTASRTGTNGKSSNIVRETVEKKIIEKHTVSMFFDAVSRETVTVCGIESSFVLICVGGDE